MSSIHIGSIIKKVENYAQSEKGKRRMQECITQYINNGVKQTAAKSRILTETDMWEATAKLIEVLQNTAQSYALPASVLRHFESLTCSTPFQMPDGSTIIYLYFGDDLHRDSLCPETYDGVRNIVALLNNGYHAKNYVYGTWDNHTPSGEARFDGRSTDTSAYIRSRKDREGLRFIQQAIQDFNGNYGTYYNVTAITGDEYQ